MESEWLWENRLLEIWDHPRLGDDRRRPRLRRFLPHARPASAIRRRTSASIPPSCCEELGVAPERIAALLATGAVFEPAHLGDVVAKSARVGNDNAALSRLSLAARPIPAA